MSDQHFLRVDNLSKFYGVNQVIKGISCGFAKGEFISLLGPSGCGKTTILRMIAGFETPSGGSIHVDGEDMTALRPNQRRLGMVFQAYALFPNLTVGDNIAFGLKVAGVPREERRARVAEMLALIGLPGFENRFPYEMSGGQQQRVALARAIAPRPRLLLLDEPLSALDAKIRVSLREEIRAIQRELGITTVFVTHDQEEALSISDRIMVMNAGNIEQLGTPHDIYNRPASRFAATFVGHLNALPAARFGADRAIRPELISLAPAPDTDTTLDGTITDIGFLGSVLRLRVDVEGTSLSIDTFNANAATPPRRGDRVTLHLASRDVLDLGAA
ncbi:putative spermidine/putrescine transport system ATP-binding protein [Devosia lucknowensis]|uniref:Putative spermidine/putrescine transport system ATP-binding protein n=1 Tax=Devosia lucknowensis TaxID=1096929 RepID=A0A1Y6FI84_9HYPH|nr:ABC transporter ATP-binding protein [Devosia lucknowensis]SMQ72163.1 putative spermidine/putrescine transport system ATP-binding protein [Devosia lucknowensis]